MLREFLCELNPPEVGRGQPPPIDGNHSTKEVSLLFRRKEADSTESSKDIVLLRNSAAHASEHLRVAWRCSCGLQVSEDCSPLTEFIATEHVLQYKH